eukprot:GHVQ01028306.1.p1 GENE.GHVQ01028306.1~~GHVQ01028306.1.p1  ORF type:complete len:259 (-),score=1.91 GHVQ01028306.1:286-1062(-)
MTLAHRGSYVFCAFTFLSLAIVQLYFEVAPVHGQSDAYTIVDAAAHQRRSLQSGITADDEGIPSDFPERWVRDRVNQRYLQSRDRGYGVASYRSNYADQHRNHPRPKPYQNHVSHRYAEPTIYRPTYTRKPTLYRRSSYQPTHVPKPNPHRHHAPAHYTPIHTPRPTTYRHTGPITYKPIYKPSPYRNASNYGPSQHHAPHRRLSPYFYKPLYKPTANNSDFRSYGKPKAGSYIYQENSDRHNRQSRLLTLQSRTDWR